MHMHTTLAYRSTLEYQRQYAYEIVLYIILANMHTTLEQSTLAYIVCIVLYAYLLATQYCICVDLRARQYVHITLARVCILLARTSQQYYFAQYFQCSSRSLSRVRHVVKNCVLRLSLCLDFTSRVLTFLCTLRAQSINITTHQMRTARARAIPEFIIPSPGEQIPCVAVVMGS